MGPFLLIGRDENSLRQQLKAKTYVYSEVICEPMGNFHENADILHSQGIAENYWKSGFSHIGIHW